MSRLQQKDQKSSPKKSAKQNIGSNKIAARKQASVFFQQQESPFGENGDAENAEKKKIGASAPTGALPGGREALFCL